MRVGGNSIIHVDIRIVAGANLAGFKKVSEAMLAQGLV